MKKDSTQPFPSMAWEVRATRESLHAQLFPMPKPHRRLLQILDGYCRFDAHCWVGNKELQSVYGCKRRNLQILLKSLEDSGKIIRVVPTEGRLRRTGIILRVRIDSKLQVADTPERLAESMAKLMERDSSIRARAQKIAPTRAQKIAPTRAQKIAPGISTQSEEAAKEKVRSANPSPAPIVGPSNQPIEREPGPDHFPPKGGPVQDSQRRRERALQLQLKLRDGHNFILFAEAGSVKMHVPQHIRDDAQWLAEILTPEVKAEFRELMPELLEILTPQAGSAVKPASATGRPPRVHPDDKAMTLPRLLDLARSHAAPEAIAQGMAARYRDAKPLTLLTFTNAARTLGPDELCGYLSEGDGKDDPAIWLAKILARVTRERSAARKDRARDGGRLASAPAPQPGPEPSGRGDVARLPKQYHEQSSMSRDAV